MADGEQATDDDLKATHMLIGAASMLKWVIASLFLMNGGALLALLNSEHENFFLLRMAGWWFVCGIVSTVTSGTMIALVLFLLGIDALMHQHRRKGRSISENIKVLENPSIRRMYRVALLVSSFAIVMALGCFVLGSMQVKRAAAVMKISEPAQ